MNTEFENIILKVLTHNGEFFGKAMPIIKDKYFAEIGNQEIFTLPKNRLFIVPGNHDIDRDKINHSLIPVLDSRDNVNSFLIFIISYFNIVQLFPLISDVQKIFCSLLYQQEYLTFPKSPCIYIR